MVVVVVGGGVEAISSAVWDHKTISIIFIFILYIIIIIIYLFVFNLFLGGGGWGCCFYIFFGGWGGCFFAESREPELDVCMRSVTHVLTDLLRG